MPPGAVSRAYPPGRQALAGSLVAVQGVLLAALVLLPGGRGWTTPRWLVAGSAAMIIAAVFLALAGALRLGAGLTASPLPSDAARLRTGAVYAYVRHPIYTALLLGGAGVAPLALLWSKTLLEKRALTARFRTPPHTPQAPHDWSSRCCVVASRTAPVRAGRGTERFQVTSTVPPAGDSTARTRAMIAVRVVATVMIRTMRRRSARCVWLAAGPTGVPGATPPPRRR